MLTFDAKTAAYLDDIYQGSDVVRRRLANFDALSPKPGEAVADIGCGTGLLTLELARAVGASGRVFGIDPSGDMLETARERCAGRDSVQVLKGMADALPLDDESVDKAVSLQVFEYLPDIPAALTEVHRVLRSNGRLVIGDMHWDTLVWSSDQPDRMARMLAAWDGHFTERSVPALLPDMLRNTGFEVVDVKPTTFVDATFRPDGIAAMLLHLMSTFAIDHDLLDQTEVEAWRDEQLARAGDGRFFFSMTHFVTVGRKI